MSLNIVDSNPQVVQAIQTAFEGALEKCAYKAMSEAKEQCFMEYESPTAYFIEPRKESDSFLKSAIKDAASEYEAIIKKRINQWMNLD